MNVLEIKEKDSFNLSRAGTYVFATILALLGLMDDYGIGVLNEIVSKLYHALLDFVVLVFVISIILAIFTAPVWVRKILKGVS